MKELMIQGWNICCSYNMAILCPIMIMVIINNLEKSLTLTRLGFLKVVFSGGSI